MDSSKFSEIDGLVNDIIYKYNDSGSIDIIVDEVLKNCKTDPETLKNAVHAAIKLEQYNNADNSHSLLSMLIHDTLKMEQVYKTNVDSREMVQFVEDYMKESGLDVDDEELVEDIKRFVCKKTYCISLDIDTDESYKDKSNTSKMKRCYERLIKKLDEKFVNCLATA